MKPKPHTVVALCQCGCGQTEILHYKAANAEEAATMAHAEHTGRRIEVVTVLEGTCFEAQ